LRGFLVALLATALVVGTGSALAARGDPKKELVPADSARARTILLKKSDLAPGFNGMPKSSVEVDSYCKALDLSDLTLTGEAESPNFARSAVFVSSAAQVYESAADARASWRRGASPAGERCARDVLRREFAEEGVELTSFRRIAFPRVAERSAAYRVEVSAQSQGITVPLVLEFVSMMHARAHAGVFFTGLTAVPRSQQLPLVRLVARRMAKAMRGA